MRNDFVRNSALVFAAQMIVNVANFAFHSLVSRRIGVVAYGSLNALIAGVILFAVPALILTTIVVKYAAEFHALSEPARLRALVLRAASLFGTAAIAVLLAGSLLAPAIAAYLHIEDVTPVLLTIIILALNVLLPIRGLLQGIEDFRAYSLSLTSEVIVKVGLALVFISFGWGIAGALGGWLLGVIASVAYTYCVVWLRYRGYPRESLNLDYPRLARTSLSVALAMLCVTSLGFSDVIIVKHFFDARAAGLYGAAALSGKILFFLVSFVPAVLLPRAANLALASRPTMHVLKQAAVTVGILAGAGLLLFWRYPELIVTTVTGDAFRAAAPLLFPYGIATTLLALLNTVVSYNIGTHRFGFVPPLIVVAVAQVVGISLFHQSALAVIYVLIVANSAALALSLYRVGALKIPVTAPASQP